MSWGPSLQLEILEVFAENGLDEASVRQSIQDGLQVWRVDYWKPSRVVAREHRRRRLEGRPPCPGCGAPPAEPRSPRSYPVYCSRACQARTLARRYYRERYDDPQGPRARCAARNAELKAARHARPRPICEWCREKLVYGLRSDCRYCSDACRHAASNRAAAERRRAARRAA